jgi:aminoglycoside N3'-acetyltransferase
VSNDIREALRANDIAGKPVCVHSSLRSFDTPPRGDELIEVFLDEGCTILVPTFSHAAFGLRPPPELRPERNGSDYDDPHWNDAGRDRVFDPSCNDVNETLGTLPRVVLHRDGRLRQHHPISSFTSLGPVAERLVGTQAPSDVYAPLAALARLRGVVLLMGVGLNRMTLIHLAEKRSGRTLFRRWANGPDGKPSMIESGGCSEGFINLEPALRPIRRVADVGGSTWQIFPARSALDIATHAIRRNQHITHCGTDCQRCDDGTAGGPIL